MRYRVGKLVVTGRGTEVEGIRFVPAVPEPPEPVRINVKKEVVDFGPVKTNGAVRILRRGDGLRVVPLPQCPPFVLEINASALMRSRQRCALGPARAVRADGTRTGQQISGTASAKGRTFRLDGSAFAYDVAVRTE